MTLASQLPILTDDALDERLVLEKQAMGSIMTEHTDHRQSWFGLFATLICILVIFTMLAPAVQDTDRRRQRNECELRLKNLALATINFDTTKKRYPTYQAEFGRLGGGSKLGSWAVLLLPFLEQQDLRDKWDDASEQENWLKAVVQQDPTQLLRFYPKLDVFTCPQDPSLKGKYAPLSYVPNAGFYLLPNDPALGLAAYANVNNDSNRSSVSQRIQNGLFANGLPAYVIDPTTGASTATFGPALKKHHSEEVRDGTSQTIAFFENCNNLNWREYSISDDSARYKLGCLWLYAGGTTSPGRPTAADVESVMRINYEKDVVSISPKRARPNSFHPRIVGAAMADGSTKGIGGSDRLPRLSGAHDSTDPSKRCTR